MPRKGFKTVAGRSLPEEYVEAMKKLSKDPKFIHEMMQNGHVRISVSLVLRKAVKTYLEDRGYHIGQTSEVGDK